MGLTFIDFFAGIGGFRKGLENAGHKCIGFCEWDKFATMSYMSMHTITEEQRQYLSTLDFKQRQKEILKEEYLNGEWYINDVKKVNFRNIPKADIYTFGAPCQDFSVAGKRRGLEGDRSSLVHEIFRIIREQNECDRPEWLIYENVKGMLSSNRGFDFLAILLEMDELGYDCEWQTFNTRYFGIPQNRERVYTVGHLRTKGERKIFPLQSSSGTDSISKINIIGHRDGFRRNTQVFDPNGAVEAIDTAEGGGRGHHTAIPLGMLRNVRNDYAKSIRKDYEQGNVEAKRADLVEKDIRTDGITNTIDTVQKDNLLAVRINKIGNIYESNSQNGDTFTIDDISSTLRSEQNEKGNDIDSNNSPKIAIPVDNNVITIKMSRSKGFSETDIAPTLLATNYKGIGNLTDNAGVVIPVMTPEKEHKRANGRRFKENEEPSFTLTTVDRHGVAIGVTPIASVYINESEKFSSPFMKDISKTLKASNDVGTVVAVDVSENTEDFSEIIVSDKIVNTNTNKIKSKSKSLFNIKSNSNVTSVEENKMISGLYVQLDDNTTVYCVWYEKYKSYIAIRKLTPKENFRLQGWSDEYFERAKFINSDSQLYKQAGNGVTVAVVEEIGKHLFNVD
jgi:DNA-cytosine methyltransferase